MADAEALRANICAKLGFFPPFFAPAMATPDVLESLWLHTETAYLDNALPPIFKEMLASLLAQHANIPYCLFCHASSLHGLGVSGSSICHMLQQPRTSAEHIICQLQQAAPAVAQWPRLGSHHEHWLLQACVVMFADPQSEALCQAVRDTLDAASYARVIVFLGYNRAILSWAKGYPEIDFTRDQRVIEHLGPLLAEEPRLQGLLGPGAAVLAAQKQMTDELTSALDSMSDGFVSVDKDWRIISVNRVFENITKRPKNEHIGANILDLFFTSDAQKSTPLYRAYHQAMQSRAPVTLEAYYAPLASWGLVNIYPKDNGGLAVFFSDISARKESEKEAALEKAKIEKIFETSPAAMAVLRGPELVLERINPVCRGLLGDRELLHRPLSAAVPELSERSYLTAAHTVFHTKKPYTEDDVETYVQRTSDGGPQRHFLDISWTPIVSSDDEIYGVFLHALDVTHRVTARQAIERTKKALKETVTDLQDERELRNTFVATLTHDLRTPISAAKLAAQLIERKLVLDAQSKKIVRRIVSAMDRADSMIRDLLDATRLKAGDGMRLKLEQADFVSLAKQVNHDANVAHGERFSIRASDQFIVGHIDVDAISRVLENLLSNAVKYGKSKAPITTHIARNENSVRLAVHNEGNIIPEQEQQKLFDAYNRTASAQQSGQKGWGIGLALVKGIAEAHGGTVGVVSRWQQGTTFFVDLPIDCRASQEGTPCQRPLI